MTESKRDITDAIKGVWEYLKTIQGALSALPGFIALVDAKADLLRISSAIKPLVYVLAVCFVAFVFLSEVARYIKTNANSPEFKRMGMRAKTYFICFVVAAGLYWVGIRYFETNLPNELWLEQAALYGFAVAAALSFGELTRALVISGLRIYIAKHRGSS